MFQRFSTVLLVLVCSTAAVFGQKTLLQIDYDKTIDNLNCSVAKFYIERNQGVYQLEAYNDSIAEFGCNYEHLMVFIKERQPQMQTNGYLAEYINNLKNEFDLQPTNSALFNRTVEVFEEDVLKQYDANEDYQDFKRNIIASLKEELRINEIGKNEIEPIIEETSSSWTGFRDLAAWQIVFIIAAILFIAFFVGFARWGRKYGDRSTLPIANIPQNTTSNNTTPTRTTTTNTNTANQLLPLAPKPKSVVQPQPVIEEVPTEIETKETEETDEAKEEAGVFYMPYPKIDGSFYESNRHKLFEYGRSTFKFEIKVVEYNLATFEIISNEDVITDIFINPEIIKPVCEVEGKQKNINSTLKSGVTRIVTVVPGTVQLKNSHWRLKQKAIIRFEYD